MDAYSTEAAAVGYSDLPPILLAGSSGAALARAESSARAAGLRIGARLPVAAAAERIEQQPKASAVWVELDHDCGSSTDDLLNLIAREAAQGRYAAVVSTTGELLDSVVALIAEPAVEILINADDAERASALAIAIGRYGLPTRASDVASDNNAERLRQLSEEVSRIASTLARLSTGPSSPPRRLEPAATGDLPQVSAETVRAVIRARRLRSRFFPEELFADPAWDMLLDLLQAEIAQLRVPVSSLCIAAAVPATTALRWLKTLVSEQIFVRRADPHDGRRVFVELAPEASHALRRYFAEVGPAASI
jgi:hypothetical protein